MKPTHYSFSRLIPWLRLSLEPKIGIKTAHKLLNTHERISHIFDMHHEPRLHFLSETLRDQLTQPPSKLIQDQLINTEIWLNASPDHYIITLEDPRYPPLLKQLHDPPLLLYLKGQITSLEQPMLAIVGARGASLGGKQIAHEFAYQLAEHRYCIISGLAQGIDAAAHQGAIDYAKQHNKPSSTVAILGTGIDLTYPPQHQHLSQLISEYGALISEFPLGKKAQKHHFPLRNRLIAGMSKGLIVVEAAIKSGSLITAQCALDNNRDVFAIPGSIKNRLSLGCHALIKDGAVLTDSPQDVLQLYGTVTQGMTVNIPTQPPSLSSQAQHLLNQLPFSPIALDDIYTNSPLPQQAVQTCLFELEINDLIERLNSGLYQRCQ